MGNFERTPTKKPEHEVPHGRAWTFIHVRASWSLIGWRSAKYPNVIFVKMCDLNISFLEGLHDGTVTVFRQIVFSADLYDLTITFTENLDNRTVIVSLIVSKAVATLFPVFSLTGIHSFPHAKQKRPRTSFPSPDGQKAFVAN
jgi:hypothetical protein